jgi:hypothetical protein
MYSSVERSMYSSVEHTSRVLVILRILYEMLTFTYDLRMIISSLYIIIIQSLYI